MSFDITSFADRAELPPFAGHVTELVQLRKSGYSKVKAMPEGGGVPIGIVVSDIELGQDVVGKRITTAGGRCSERNGEKGIFAYAKEVQIDGVQLQGVRPQKGQQQSSAPASGGAPAAAPAPPPPAREAVAEADIVDFIERLTTKFPWMTEGHGPACINSLIIALGRNEIRLNPGIDSGGNLDVGGDMDDLPS